MNEKMKLTRGERNNNPLNIKYGKSKWVGKVTENKQDAEFEEFDSLLNGLRAAIKLVQNYIKSGRTTVDEIVRRWCPDDTQDAYVDYVLDVMQLNHPGFGKYTQLRWHDYDRLFTLISAMAWMESRMRVDSKLFLEAWQSLDTHNQSNREKRVKGADPLTRK